MTLRIEDQAKRARELLQQPDVIEAMRIRCEETDHDWESCLTVFFQVYRQCKWCGVIRGRP